MKNILIFWTFILFSCTSHVKKETFHVLNGNELKVTGRYLLQGTRLEMISSACYFTIQYRGSQCKLYASAADANTHAYLQYELDGSYGRRIKVGNEDTTIIDISSPHDSLHTLTIFKASEAITGPLYLHRIEAIDAKSVSKPKALAIEFIGNSITCGAAADDSEIPCGQGLYHDQHNAYFSYASRTARALHADFMLSSVSGIGIYRNWNSEGPTMPMVYENTDLSMDRQVRWDFASFQPNILCIALGTNDYSDGDGGYDRKPFDPNIFIVKYIDFIKKVKQTHRAVPLVLLDSPMLQGERKIILQTCLQKIKAAIDSQYPDDLPVALHFFKPMHPGGCTTHPNVKDHQILAEELIPVLKKVLSRK